MAEDRTTLNLRTPGPVPVPQDILNTMAEPMINHRGPEFRDLLYSVTDRLKRVYQTKNDLYIFTSSGTGAMEAAIVNSLSPGDQVLCATAGVFGDRFGHIAEQYGVDVDSLRFPYGTAVDPEKVREALDANPDIQAVLVVHNETSTGVAHDLHGIAQVVKGEFDKLLLVDGISSACSLPLATDGWGCDVVVSASQKGWMLPPGLAFISFSERAWEAHAKSKMPRFYFDISTYQRYYEIGQTPYTPVLSAMFALDLALDMILGEGIGSIFERHADIGQMTREGVKALGLSLFPAEANASNTVTDVNVPEGVDAQRLLGSMSDEHGVVLAAGQQSLRGKIFRIGHLGACTPDDIQDSPRRTRTSSSASRLQLSGDHAMTMPEMQKAIPNLRLLLAGPTASLKKAGETEQEKIRELELFIQEARAGEAIASKLDERFHSWTAVSPPEQRREDLEDESEVACRERRPRQSRSLGDTLQSPSVWLCELTEAGWLSDKRHR